jgi:hypothetical protein
VQLGETPAYDGVTTNGTLIAVTQRSRALVVVFTPREQAATAQTQSLRPDKKNRAVACSHVVVTAAEPVTSSTRGSAKTCRAWLGLVVR